jgi:hypothetical protein
LPEKTFIFAQISIFAHSLAESDAYIHELFIFFAAFKIDICGNQKEPSPRRVPEGKSQYLN